MRGRLVWPRRSGDVVPTRPFAVGPSRGASLAAARFCLASAVSLSARLEPCRSPATPGPWPGVRPVTERGRDLLATSTGAIHRRKSGTRRPRGRRRTGVAQPAETRVRRTAVRRPPLRTEPLERSALKGATEGERLQERRRSQPAGREPREGSRCNGAAARKHRASVPTPFSGHAGRRSGALRLRPMADRAAAAGHRPGPRGARRGRGGVPGPGARAVRDGC